MGPSRDSTGNLVPDPLRFPDGIKPVADYVHSLGLKLGLYEDAGTTTCAHLPGSYGHEAQDAAEFAAWGVDYVKYDRCNIPYGDFPGLSQSQADQIVFRRMSDALKATGRPIVFSACDPVPAANPATWGPQISNLWRGTPDLQDNFGSMLVNFEGTVDQFRLAHPGAWNDPDLLQVGNGGSTPVEYRTEFSLWAEMAAPLIASTNLTTLTPAARAILENPNVIAIDQDPLARPGVPISNARGLWALSKKLRGGDRSVVLFNSTDTAATITTSAIAVGLRAAAGYRLQNLWTGTTSETAQTISAFVPGHGATMFRVSALPRRRLAALPPHTVLSLSTGAPQLVVRHSTIIRESFTDAGTTPVKHLKLSFHAPAGWRVRPLDHPHLARVAPGQRVMLDYRVTAPSSGPPITLRVLSAKASYDPPDGPASASARLGETVSVPVSAPFATANVTSTRAWFGAADGSVSISARGTGVFPSYEGLPPTDSYAAIYERGAAGTSSSAQVTVTYDQAGGHAGGAGLIERGAIDARAGSSAAVVLYLSSDGSIEMAWNARGGRDVDTWYKVQNLFVRAPVTLRLVRSGSTYTGYYSTDAGVTWNAVDSVTVAPSASAGAQDVGVFHASGLPTWTTVATFKDLLIN
jgi:alpha-galactosidase